MTNRPRAATLDRVGKAIDLRNSGATWQHVADQLGYRSPSSAAASVRQYVDRMAEGNDVGHLLAMEELKLQQRERYIMAAAAEVPADDVGGRDTVDRARDRIAKHRAFIHGLGKVNVDHTVTVQPSTTTILADARKRLLEIDGTIEGEIVG
ncbi:hypothetical protein [Rhodococcus sp. BS-15]|uniref:hypothetical protein n=1 Tax=Rhodococcus sp. BS-15 TaxID=1304954 RepID=UPI000A3E010F|nr:hypothetical protein [Rhodococcus sp. BS-15]